MYKKAFYFKVNLNTIHYSDYEKIVLELLKQKQQNGEVVYQKEIKDRLPEQFSYIIKGENLTIRDIKERLNRSFEIYENLNEQIQSYSHGMRQKIVICGALLSEPKNWILDEPMTGLDPKSSFDLKEMMRMHAKSGKTVFFSTHILEVAEKLCDRVGIINKGKLVFVGTFEALKEKFKENGSLEELFLEITEKG